MKILRHLYVQVLIAIVLGVILGYTEPAWGAAMKPLGDIFIALIRMMIDADRERLGAGHVAL